MKPEAVDKLFDLTGRVAIITGGSRGIGRSIAHSFAAKDAKVVIASRKADMCDQVVDEIQADGGDAFAVPTQMSDLDGIANLVKATVDHYGGIDIIVNNAANALTQPFGEVTPEAWAKSFDVNLARPGLFWFRKPCRICARASTPRSSTSPAPGGSCLRRSRICMQRPRPGCSPTPARWRLSWRPTTSG